MRFLTLASALFAAVLAVSGNPTTEVVYARGQCRRTDGTLEVREWSSAAVAKRDGGCNLSNAGGAGDPLPNSFCQSTFGDSAPCCVEDGVGGAFCTTCTHGIHNC
ncbi:hypothetical protein L226DRAFT_537295 [Lentinus tigrinus ALCF2SS1-7]|uniref:Uncharacterized protein n=1 Tax=Lentinus tigrinus ALCF2SS1-6 TaxID=1328759 RepID=A0A5C2S3R4_9APHY|nr:hypothetical protein L227DRAFT_577497 [Lentinus tigrinus ALCF2SS1-6]RPD72164.1 hypothetical protein L226DRAFT_537295 [Lentinus tigrinus ALCF2SS1-7]